MCHKTAMGEEALILIKTNDLWGVFWADNITDHCLLKAMHLAAYWQFGKMLGVRRWKQSFLLHCWTIWGKAGIICLQQRENCCISLFPILEIVISDPKEYCHFRGIWCCEYVSHNMFFRKGFADCKGYIHTVSPGKILYCLYWFLVWH